MPEVRHYYLILDKRRISLFFIRMLDFTLALILMVLLSPLFLFLAILIKADSPGPVFFRQVRITRNGSAFRIHKFRSMEEEAESKGTLITQLADRRITKVGKFIRKFRLDEISQLIDILQGHMSFVGTRPEVPVYVDSYTAEMKATLLLPAGITSSASIHFLNEDAMLAQQENIDEFYVNKILPIKMKYNLGDLSQFGLRLYIKLLFGTVFAMFKKKREKEGQDHNG